MVSIKPCAIPEHALLQRYQREGYYTDCYVSSIKRQISQAQFIEAFYTTRLFKLERWILKWAVSKPSTDAQAGELAAGTLKSFAAWRVEAGDENQLLMCDFQQKTRSWLMAESQNGAQPYTKLYFGSAVVPVENPKTGELSLGPVYRMLLGFHKRYSIWLLHAATRRLMAQSA